MRQRTSPAPGMGQELLSNRRGSDHSKNPKNINYLKRPRGKNRLIVLEQIADRWAAQGLYQSPSRAMAALLGVSE